MPAHETDQASDAPAERPADQQTPRHTDQQAGQQAGQQARQEGAGPYVVAVRCPNLFHDEVEGGESIVRTAREVADRAELEALLGRGVEVHARCYCGHATMVTAANALLLGPGDG